MNTSPNNAPVAKLTNKIRIFDNLFDFHEIKNTPINEINETIRTLNNVSVQTILEY